MRTRRGIGWPLALGVVMLALLVVLSVGWPIAVVDAGASRLTPELTRGDWALLLLGIACLAGIAVGLVWLCAWLVREMRTNQSQRAFLDAVTHEMKTPLASLRLCLDTLALHELDAARRREFLANMDQDVERLRRTVEQVLAAARADEPGLRLPLQPVALCELLRSCAGEIRAHHALPEEAIALDLAPETFVRANPSALGVVFRNLLENAIVYSENPVRVQVRAERKSEDRVQVSIEDRGIGIPARELRKIFRRFYRSGRAVTRSSAGLGLGLFIVRTLVRRQGGRVVARSEGSGAGSRFVVTLRAAAVNEAASIS
jgi:signal transduction histidine kinase